MPLKKLTKQVFPLTYSYNEYLKRLCLFLDQHLYGVFINGNEFKHGFPCELACSNTNPINSILDLEKQDLSQSLYGILPYDLKNEWEGLESNNHDSQCFDDLFLFNPEIIINLSPSQLIIQSANPRETLSELDNIKFKEENQPTLSFTQTTSKDEYIDTVNQIKEDILNGEVYEINYCTEFICSNKEINPVNTYLHLNSISPTPFSSLVKNNTQWLIGASPERFIKREGQKVLSQPIKGTSKRENDPIEDLRNKNYLLNSDKEKAENLMIVDLVRNDLSRTAIPGTVKVDELFGIYSFRQVHQMISTISAKVQHETTSIDIIKNAFPMGSMTGAPKIRAMQLIEKYEKQKRSWFSGAVGYINNQEFDFNVVIRSLFYNQKQKTISFQVGSAITIDSNPELEYEECALKAKALLQCFNTSL